MSKFPSHTKADLFDGKSAKPIQGEVKLLNEKLVFTPSIKEESKEFSYDVIRSIKSLRNKVCIELGSEGNLGIQLFVDDPQFANALRKQRIRRQRNPLKIVVFWFWGLSTAKRLLVSLICLPFALFFFFSFTGQLYHLVPRSFDQTLSESLYNEFFKKQPICHNHSLNSAVTQILREISLPEGKFDYQATILLSDELNAFTIGGKHIYVYGKLIAQSESPEELAGVLAHEIGHAEHRHVVKHIIHRIGLIYAVSTIIGAGFEEDMITEHAAEYAILLLGFRHSRASEKEADAHAFWRLKKSKISAQGLKNFFQTITKIENQDTPSWFRTHPQTKKRIRFLEKKLKEETIQSKPLLPNVNWKSIRNNCI